MPRAKNTGTDKKQFNDMSIIAFVLSFFQPLAGLILGIIALARINKTREQGKGLAIASIIVGFAMMIIITIYMIAFFVAMAGLR